MVSIQAFIIVFILLVNDYKLIVYTINLKLRLNKELGTIDNIVNKSACLSNFFDNEWESKRESKRESIGQKENRISPLVFKPNSARQ